MDKIVFITEHGEKSTDIYEFFKILFPECEIIIVPRENYDPSRIQKGKKSLKCFCMENFGHFGGKAAAKQ